MLGNKYEYALIDFSYILSRNLFACSKGKDVGEFDEGDVMRLTIQTINKLSRDWGISADKMVLVYDCWDKSINGYWRTYLLRNYVAYKGSRKFMTAEKLESMKADPKVSPEELKKAELELYTNQVKYRAKRGMIDDFGKIGLPSIGVESFEFDDLAWLATSLLYGDGSGKSSIIITKDSDLMYSLSPKMDYFRLPTNGSEPVIITYNEMYNKIPLELLNRGVSLYQYKAFQDSLGFGHNDMKTTIKSGADMVTTILQILDGDFSNIKNIDAFRAQMNSFDLASFPKIELAKTVLLEKLGTSGHLGGLDDFHDLCSKYEISEISDRYYSDFISRFDQRLFSE